MLIEAPCRLGERFEHKKPWGTPRLYLGVIEPSFFYGKEDVVFQGAIIPNMDYHAEYILSDDLLEKPVRFEVPNHMVRGGAGAPLREFGLEQDRLGWITALRLERDGGWKYWIAGDKGVRGLQVRTETLDQIFAPVLPVVRISTADFL